MSIPVMHGYVTLKELTEVIDVFAPPREDMFTGQDPTSGGDSPGRERRSPPDL